MRSHALAFRVATVLVGFFGVVSSAAFAQENSAPTETFRIVENAAKSRSGVLGFTIFDAFGAPRETVSIVPTSTESGREIARLAVGETYACRLELPTALPGQIVTSQLRCVPQEQAFHLETSQTANRSLEDVYDAIDSKEILFREDVLSIVRVKEDDITSCRRYFAKPPRQFQLTTSCVFNRKDPLTGLVHSCLNEDDCI